MKFEKLSRKNLLLGYKIRELFRKRIVRDFFLYVSGTIFLGGISFFLIPIYTRVLTPVQYGKLDLLNMFIAILSSVLGLGLASTVTIFYYNVEKRKRVETITGIVVTYLIIALPFIILMLLNINLLGEFIFKGKMESYLIVIAILIVFTSFFPTVYYNVLKMERKAVKRTIFQASVGLSVVVTNIYLVYYRRLGIGAILSISLISMMIVSMIGALEYIHKFKKIRVNFSLRTMKEFLKISVPIMPATLVMWALNSSDRWILVNYTSYQSLGVYSLAYKFGYLWVFLILTPFAAAYVPRLYRDYRKDLVKTEIMNMKVLRWYLVFSLLVIMFIVGVLYFVFPFLVGSEFQSAYQYIWIILLGYVFYGAFSLANHLLYILKRTWWATICATVGAGINISLNLIFIPKYGNIAAAYTTMFSFLVMFLIILMIRNITFHKIIRGEAKGDEEVRIC